MLENERFRQIEKQLYELERKTSYKILEYDPKKWYFMVGELEGPDFVDWGSRSGWFSSGHQYSYGAGDCFCGVVFKQDSGIYVPNLFHFYDEFNISRDKNKIRSILTSGLKISGLVGSSVESMKNSKDKDLYIDELGLTPLISPPNCEFNLFVSASTKQVIYTFNPDPMPPILL
jgi:hypothetical protein